MKFKEIQGHSPTELNKKVKELSGELTEAKMKNQLGQLGNPLVIRDMRKNLARLKTALQAKAGK